MANPYTLFFRPTDTILHRTITALDGKAYPVPSHADWETNTKHHRIARFYVDLTVHSAGPAGLTEDPQLTFRPYVRNGGSTGYVAAGAPVSYTRPRMADVAGIYLQKTVNIGVAYTDYSAAMIDNSASTEADLSALDTVANGDWAVATAPSPFAGVALDFDAAKLNANASTIAAHYWNGAWTALTPVDGTIAVATKTMSGDGQINWPMPAANDWVSSTIGVATGYHVRLSVSAALSASVGIEEMDVIFPIKCGIDVECNGDDVLLMVQSQDATATGALAVAGTIRVGWYNA
jgi:hypothetical protein